MAREKKIFVPITKCPEKGDKWYTRKLDGGISLAQWEGNPQAWPGSTIANCVGETWGDAASHEGNPDCRIGCKPGTDWPGNAKDWLKFSKAQGYETSMTPELGAVAVWDQTNGLGHVCEVEKMYPADQSWDSSESGYRTRPAWFTRHYNKNGYRPGYKFLGYILPKYEYILEPEPTPQPKFKVGDEVIICGSLYRSANAAKPSGTVKNKKTKIVLYAEGTMHPYNTTGYLGWMNAEDIRLANETPEPTPELKVGDCVTIIANGNSRPDGKGRISGGIGWKRYIMSIKAGMAYPYQVGVNGRTTGYYKASALKKI